MEDGSPPSDMRVDEAQPQEAEIVAIRLATSRRNIPDQSESLASSVDTSPAKSVAPTSSSSPSAHVHSTPTGRFAWLTCPDDVLVDFCTTADAKVDALLAAAERGLVAAVSAYTAARATPPVELGACLLRAAAMGRLSVAEELLREGSLCPVESADATGATPAHRAADGNHAALLELLVARGGVGCLLARDAVGRTPLHAAVSACAMDAVATLVRAGASGAATDDRGRTPLDLARTRLDVALADDRDSSGKKAARWRRIVSALGGDELQQRHADERVRGRVADAQGVAEEDGDESGLPGASGADLSAYVAAAAAASLPAAPSSAAPADLPTLLVMLLAKLKASVDQVRVSTHPPLQILVLRATCVPPARAARRASLAATRTSTRSSSAATASARPRTSRAAAPRWASQVRWAAQVLQVGMALMGITEITGGVDRCRCRALKGSRGPPLCTQCCLNSCLRSWTA